MTKMYRFEYADHDIPLNYLFQNLYKLFLRVRNLNEIYFAYLSDCQNPFFFFFR